MPFDLVQIRTQAEERADENYRFRNFLKIQSKLDADELDELVFATTRSVWAEIDCTQCANCCREVKPEFTDEEVDRLARRLELTGEEFIAKYLQPSGDEIPWITRITPCPFLKENLCSVYDDRPATCRGYPYLYENDFVFRTIAMMERTYTCPIVFNVIEELKKTLGFLRADKRRTAKYRRRR